MIDRWLRQQRQFGKMLALVGVVGLIVSLAFFAIGPNLEAGISSSGHVTGETIQARFKRVADRADVRVRGDRPTSKMGRRFWYTTYNQALTDLLENLDVIADEQGSSDASVVLKNYLSEAERRKYRRDFMHERLAEAFGR